MTARIFILLIFNQALAWRHPPALFIEKFANVHQLNMIVTYIPDNSASDWMEWHSNHQKIQKNSRIKQMSYKSQSNDVECITNDNELHIYIQNDDDLERSLDIFKQIYSKRQREDHEFWLLDVSSWKGLEDIVKLLENMPLDLDDNLFLYSFEDEEETLRIWEFYEIHSSRPRKILEYGRWNKLEGLSLVPETKWVRRKDLEGINLRALTLKYPPYVTRLTPINEAGDEYKFEGLVADFFHNLQTILNFTYTLRQPPDGAWGSLRSNGSWNGMIGELNTQKADIGSRHYDGRPYK